MEDVVKLVYITVDLLRIYLAKHAPPRPDAVGSVVSVMQKCVGRSLRYYECSGWDEGGGLY